MNDLNHICVLGTGTSVPENNVFPSSYLISINKRLFLIDAGPGICGRIVSLGYCLNYIETILITHIHSDHTMGIAEIVMALIHDDRISQHTINICISSNYINFIKNELMHPWKKWIDKCSKIQFNYIPLTEKITNKSDLYQNKPFTVNHHASSLGMLIETGGKRIAFTGDTDMFPIERELLKHADILFIESTTDDNHKIPGHLTVSEAVDLIQRTGIPVAYLTHILPQYRQNVIKTLEKCSKKEGQHIKTAVDGQIIPLI